jgi:hypothetical protein
MSYILDLAWKNNPLAMQISKLNTALAKQAGLSPAEAFAALSSGVSFEAFKAEKDRHQSATTGQPGGTFTMDFSLERA